MSSKTKSIPIPGGRLYFAAIILLAVGFVVVLGLLGRETGVIDYLPGLEVGKVRSAPEGAEVGRLVHKAGTVLRKETVGIEWIRAREGMRLYADDRIRTTQGSTCLMDLKGSQFTLDEGSMMVISQAGVQLKEGTVDVDLREGAGMGIQMAGSRIRARRRDVAFISMAMALPTDPKGLILFKNRYIASILEGMGTTDVPVSLRADFEKASEAIGQGDYDRAGEIQKKAWDELVKVRSAHQSTEPARISISRDSGGNERIQVLEGEIAIQSGVNTLDLKAGTGTLIRMAGGTLEEHQLLPAPELIGPANLRTIFNQKRVELKWDAQEGATKYRVEVSISAGFMNIIFLRWTREPRITPTIDLPEGDYYWRVRSKDTSGFIGLVSGTSRFTLVTDHEPPALRLKNRSGWHH